MAFTVGELAKLAHLSVRALHHYDEIGLLRPTGRTQSGYRLYSNDDASRLQQISFLRELGLPLEQIARALSSKHFDREKALHSQRALLIEKIERMKETLAKVDRSLDAIKRGAPMNAKDMFPDFDSATHEAHAQEAEQRWGQTREFSESMKRTKGYTKDDWQKIRDESEAIATDFASALAEKKSADDAQVQELVERHRMHIDRWFYPCSKKMHEALAEMYVADPRFTANIDKKVAGLAEYMRDAVLAGS